MKTQLQHPLNQHENGKKCLSVYSPFIIKSIGPRVITVGLLLIASALSLSKAWAAEKILISRYEASSEAKEEKGKEGEVKKSVINQVGDGFYNQWGWISTVSEEPQWLIAYFPKPESVRAMDIHMGNR